MACNGTTTTNIEGIPYFPSTTTTVSETSVNISLGFARRSLSPVGYFTVRVAQEIPADTTGTLPVTISFNGVTRNLTLFNGNNVTASDILGGNGVLMIFNDRFNSILQLIDRTVI